MSREPIGSFILPPENDLALSGCSRIGLRVEREQGQSYRGFFPKGIANFGILRKGRMELSISSTTSRDLSGIRAVALVALGFFGAFLIPSASFADSRNGERIFSSRCAMCLGTDIRGTGPLATKSAPPTPDLTTPAFRQRLVDYPGVIISSVILRPNGDLIPRTLRENGVRLPAFTWTVKDFRDLNEYMTGIISRGR